jgi:methyl-accepting chemotaxis protein
MGSIALLAQRDYSTPVAALARRDELGRMADALEALRLSALDAERLGRETAERQAAEMARARTVQTLSQSFQTHAAMPSTGF